MQQRAVFNYTNNTWSFIDLPNVSSATLASLNLAVATYSNLTQTYDGAGFTYASQDAQDLYEEVCLFLNLTALKPQRLGDFGV